MADSGANGERGSTDDLPWASVFDPAANARALSAIQAEGFRAASEIVERFIRIVTPESAPDGDPQSAPQDGKTAAGTVSDLETLTRSWWSMMGRMLLQSAPRPGATGDSGSSFELSGEKAEGGVDLADDGSGTASAEVWLHNRGRDDVGGEDLGVVALRCSPLMAAGGEVIAADATAFDPEFVPMPARSSRGVIMTVQVPQGLPPGPYRGTLLVDGHSDLWLPVVLTVGSPAP